MLNMYSVYDVEKKIYSNPIFTPNTLDVETADVEAIRIFKAQLFDRKNLIAMFPDKFELHYIGWFDEVEGLTGVKAGKNKVIITGDDAVKELQNEPSEN